MLLRWIPLATVALLFFVPLLIGTVLGDNASDKEDTSDNETDKKSSKKDEVKLNYEKDDGVVVLTEKNFDAFLEANPSVLVEFYAPWCGHCKALAPEYVKAAEKVSIPLAKVDATVETQLATRFDVSGYPTLKFWHNSKDPIDYDGPRDADGIIQWVMQRTDPNYKPPPEAVMVLTDQNFDEVIGAQPLALVEFYAPWCGHCKKLAPEYEKAARTLKEQGKDVLLAKVDATAEKRLTQIYSIKGYPTLYMFRNGKRFDYNGPRTADGIVEYMTKQSLPAAKKLDSVKRTQRFFNKTDITVLAFLSDERSRLHDAFLEMAEMTREELPAVGYTLSKDVMAHFSAEPDTVVLFQPEIFWTKYEPQRYTFSKSDASAEDLLTFVRDNSAALVGQMTRKNMANRYSKLPLVVVYYNVDFSLELRKGTQYWRTKVVEIANKYKKDNYHFAVADEEEFNKELADVGLGDSGLDQNVVVFGADGKKYPMNPEEFDDDDLSQNLLNFMKKISAGKVKPFIKSAPLPKDDKGPVMTLVALNYEKIANDEKKDVLVEFYAPWCGHCKDFEPIYKQMAVELKPKEPNLIVAKFDAINNEHPSGIEVKGFPTIYFIPAAKDAKPIRFEGLRMPEEIIKFMRKHAIVSFKGKQEYEKTEL